MLPHGRKYGSAGWGVLLEHIVVPNLACDVDRLPTIFRKLARFNRTSTGILNRSPGTPKRKLAIASALVRECRKLFQTPAETYVTVYIHRKRSAEILKRTL
jgi:hypothetical protein